VGRRRKKLLNARRQRRRGPGGGPSQPVLGPQPEGTPPGEPEADAPPPTAEVRLEGIVLDESGVATSSMLPYVRMIVSLIEGIAFTCREVVELLCLTMRQHSIGDPRTSDYAWRFPFRRPP